MLGFTRKKPPIDPSTLARYYTREEVIHLLALLSGAVIDGDAMLGWGILEETPEYITVSLDVGKEFLDIQFYKQPGGKTPPCS